MPESVIVVQGSVSCAAIKKNEGDRNRKPLQQNLNKIEFSNMVNYILFYLFGEPKRQTPMGPCGFSVI